jgi:hypothetical protein
MPIWPNKQHTQGSLQRKTRVHVEFSTSPKMQTIPKTEGTKGARTKSGKASLSAMQAGELSECSKIMEG